MSELVITYKGASIEAKSGFVEVFFRFAALHVCDTVNCIGNEIRDDWLFISSGGHSEIFGPDFDGILRDTEGREIAFDAIRTTLDALRRVPPQIDSSLLNALWPHSRFYGPMDSEKLIELGEALLGLLSHSERAHSTRGKRF